MRLIDADVFKEYADKPSIFDTTDLKVMIDEQPTVSNNLKENNTMRKFITTLLYQYHEMQAVEQYTDKTFTLTQRATLFTSDYYTVYRFIAIENVNANTIAEPDSYVYQFNYMCTGCTLTSVIVDEQTAQQFISDNLLNFMQGKINLKTFQEYFEKT